VVRRIVTSLWVLVLLACNSSVEVETKVEKKYNVYTRTEMALLMLDMYTEMEENKERILNSHTIDGEFPASFEKIYTAELTSPEVRDDHYKAFATAYINSLNKLYSTSEVDLKNQHNEVVSTCIACHQEKCLGPIPKIKKLFID
jgi:cytochrome c553